MNGKALRIVLFVTTVLYSELGSRAPAQTSTTGSFQAAQIGGNTFVSSAGGEVYLIFDKHLYRNTRSEGDYWDRLTTAEMKAVATDPHSETLLYGIDGQNHVVKSLDVGKSWRTLNTGTSNSALLTIIVNPANSQDVLVGTSSGIVESTDAGFSWQATSFARPVDEILIDGRAPSNEYLVSAGVAFASSDGGQTWRQSSAGLPLEVVRGTGRTASKVPPKISFLFYVDRQEPFLLAVTSQKGVFRSNDHGVSWLPTGSGLVQSEAFVAATAGTKRIVLASSKSLYSSSDGLNWTKMPIKSRGIAPDPYIGLIEYPKHDGLLVHFRSIQGAGDAFRIGYLDSNGVLVGLNYGVTPHSQVDNVWMSKVNGQTVLFAISANQYYTDLTPDQVSRNSRPTYTYLSLDQGYSWELLGTPICGDRAVSPADTSEETLIYGRATCVTRTQDGGTTWQVLHGILFQSFSGLTHPSGYDSPAYNGGFGLNAKDAEPFYGNENVLHLHLDPVDHNIAYYTVGTNEHYVFRYQYNPNTRQGQAVDLKTIAADVLIDDANHLNLYTDSGKLSTDGGWTWTDKSNSIRSLGVETGNYQPNLKLLSFHGGEIRALIPYGQNAFNGYPGDIAIVRSQDLGSTWATVKKLQILGLLKGPFINTDDPMNFFIAALTAPKGIPGAFGASYKPDTARVLETKDGGATWKQIYKHVAGGQLPVQELIRGVAQVNHDGGRSLLLATSEGLLRSEDEGTTWKTLGGVQ